MKLILLTLAFISAFSHAHAKAYRAKDARARNIDSMMAFAPQAHVSMITDGNQRIYSDSLSAITRRQQTDVMKHYAEKIKLKQIWETDDTALRSQVDAEIFVVINAMEGGALLEKLPKPPKIDSIMNALGFRYGLIVLDFGFVRTRGNFKQQRKKGNLQGLATLGMYEEQPIKSGCAVLGMIMDNKEHRTYYYKQEGYGPDDGINPTEYESMRTQFYYLFNRFFWVDPNRMF